MRIQSLLLLAALALQLPALGQDADYPTLAALANLEVPPFDYVAMVGRMSGKDASYAPPTEAPHYEIGDMEVFTLRKGADAAYERVDMELRGLTDRVLIWVQADLDYPRWRARNMAQRIETQALDPMQRLFQFEEPPGIDGDPRLYVALMMDDSEAALAYFHKTSTLPRRFYASSNEREMLVVNLARAEGADSFDHLLVEVVAHEYIHILHHHSDFGEENWLDEGLAGYAGYIASSYRSPAGIAQRTAGAFLEAPQTGLTQWFAVEDKTPKYGAAFLFVLYLAERFGKGIVPALLKEQANGWPSVAKALRDFTDVSADEVFADWVLANYFLDFGRGYGYRSLDAELSAPTPAASYNSYPATRQGELRQYSAEYIALDVRGADKLSLRLRQAQEARLVDEAEAGGGHFYYALTSIWGNSALTRQFDLTEVDRAWLEFQIWHNLTDDLEYGYVSVSADGGITWEALTGLYMSPSEVYEDYFPRGYTRRRANWAAERINLSKYAPGRILLRFEVNSSYHSKYGGMAIDDLRIRAIGYHEDFEAPDASWIADGWARADNRLPNNTWLQAAQDTREGIQVSRSLISGSGELNVDILPGVSHVLLAVSPVVPYTSLTSEFELELNLLNAAGEVMAVHRECSVMTTHALNFRASPNGAKIGLVPRAAALDAFDREGDWFKVDYTGRPGWIHADYAHSAGNCP